jgi:Fe-S oxidoreductase
VKNIVHDVNWALEEASKCVFCGFCESVCPTFKFGLHRGYGPRGRVNIIRFVLKEEKFTEEAIKSIYTCLLCAACTLKCPAKIDIPELVRVARSYYIKNKVRSEKSIWVMVR